MNNKLKSLPFLLHNTLKLLLVRKVEKMKRWPPKCAEERKIFWLRWCLLVNLAGSDPHLPGCLGCFCLAGLFSVSFLCKSPWLKCAFRPHCFVDKNSIQTTNTFRFCAFRKKEMLVHRWWMDVHPEMDSKTWWFLTRSDIRHGDNGVIFCTKFVKKWYIWKRFMLKIKMWTTKTRRFIFWHLKKCLATLKFFLNNMWIRTAR